MGVDVNKVIAANKAAEPKPEPPKPEVAIGELTVDEIIQRVKANPKLLQFQNSLKFIQGGTNMSLERMELALVALCADLYIEGMKAGAQEMLDAR